MRRPMWFALIFLVTGSAATTSSLPEMRMTPAEVHQGLWKERQAWGWRCADRERSLELAAKLRDLVNGPTSFGVDQPRALEKTLPVA